MTDLRPSFRIDEEGDLIVTTRYGVEYRITEQIVGWEEESSIAIWRIDPPTHGRKGRIYDPQPIRLPGGSKQRRK